MPRLRQGAAPSPVVERESVCSSTTHNSRLMRSFCLERDSCVVRQEESTFECSAQEVLDAFPHHSGHSFSSTRSELSGKRGSEDSRVDS